VASSASIPLLTISSNSVKVVLVVPFKVLNSILRLFNAVDTEVTSPEVANNSKVPFVSLIMYKDTSIIPFTVFIVTNI
jgi:hypothetical protein